MNKSSLDVIQNARPVYKLDEIEELSFDATDAEPGSAEKIEILARRIREGFPLWHPDDRHAEDLPNLIAFHLRANDLRANAEHDLT